MACGKCQERQRLRAAAKQAAAERNAAREAAAKAPAEKTKS